MKTEEKTESFREWADRELAEHEAGAVAQKKDLLARMDGMMPSDTLAKQAANTIIKTVLNILMMQQSTQAFGATLQAKAVDRLSERSIKKFEEAFAAINDLYVRVAALERAVKPKAVTKRAKR
jgi:hypothetical protein